MKTLNLKNLGIREVLQNIGAKRSKDADVKDIVVPIIEKVREFGDSALYEYAECFDGVKLDSLRVTKAEIDEAYKKIDKRLFEAIKIAKKNIEVFHDKILKKKERSVETVKGVKVWREFRPIDKVGLYVPGGKAAYFSTVLMLGVPAMLAGCKEIVMCTPVSRNFGLNAGVLVAADLCGIKKIYKIGGAQAIAAMAYGTESIAKVYKIFGPGNQYVSTAKMLVYGEVDIDMPAGPSEVLAIADESANPQWIAADLLSQLEHGEDSQAILVAFSESFVEKVVEEMKAQMSELGRREIMEKSFAKSFAVIVDSVEEACEITNGYAPEHLEIVCKKEADVLRKINNVGSVFLGPYSSEPLGDYATGANHTLPTAGYAKMFNPLSTLSFGKMIQIQRVSEEGIKGLKDVVEKMAEAEGLDAHKNSVTIRFK